MSIKRWYLNRKHFKLHNKALQNLGGVEEQTLEFHQKLIKEKNKIKKEQKERQKEILMGFFWGSICSALIFLLINLF